MEELEVYPVMLPVEGGFYSYGSIMLDNRGPFLWLNRSEACNSYFHKSQHLYLISDEEIKEGDWFIDFGHVGKGPWKLYPDIPWFWDDLNQRKLCKKVEATTDPSLNLPLILPSFIEEYVEKQGKIDKVKMLMHPNFPDLHLGGKYVRIYPIKDSWNREEVKKIAKAAHTEFAGLPSEFDTWFDKNY